MKDAPPTCKDNHPRTEKNTYINPAGHQVCRVCIRERKQKRTAETKHLSLIERLVRRQANSLHRPLTPRECLFQHEMQPIEPYVWWCNDRMCGVLVVFFNFPGSYRYTSGTQFIFFSEDESRKYREGDESLADLVTRRIEREEA